MRYENHSITDHSLHMNSFLLISGIKLVQEMGDEMQITPAKIVKLNLMNEERSGSLVFCFSI